MVFSDGEDLNSTFKSSVVESEAKGLANFEAYSVDYMPGPTLNPFLKSFAEAHGGRIGDISIYGQESNHTTWRLAKMNLAIRGIEGNLGKEQQFPLVRHLT